jgi:hypothetical protein
MNHQQKIKMARKMLTKQEKEEHHSLFLSSAWLDRSQAIKNRLQKIKEKAIDKQKLKNIVA